MVGGGYGAVYGAVGGVRRGEGERGKRGTGRGRDARRCGGHGVGGELTQPERLKGGASMVEVDWKAGTTPQMNVFGMYDANVSDNYDGKGAIDRFLGYRDGSTLLL